MKTIAIILFLVIPLKGISQNSADIKKFENLFKENKVVHNWGDHLKNNKNEFSFVFSAFFVIYKELLSSQDVDACVFTPSCSVYAIESLKKKGIIIGYFDSIDRLTRCNPGRNKELPVNLITGKYSDPVE